MPKTIFFFTFLVITSLLTQAKLGSTTAFMKKVGYDNSFKWESSNKVQDFVKFFSEESSEFCSDYCGGDMYCYQNCVALEDVYQSDTTNTTSVAVVCSQFCGNFHVLECFDLCTSMMNAFSTLNRIHSQVDQKLDFKPSYEEQKIEEWQWNGESVKKGIEEWKNYGSQKNENLNLDINVKELTSDQSKSQQKDNFLQMGKKHKSVIQQMLQTASKAQDSHYSNYYIDCEVTCEGDENCENMCEEANDQYLEVKWNLPDTCEDFCDTMVPIQMPVWEGERNSAEYEKCLSLCEKYDLVDLVD